MFIAWVLNVHAQTRAPLVQPEGASCVLPFTLVGKLIVVQATADTAVGNFILDTGAPGLILNATYFRDYPTISVVGSTQQTIAGDGGEVQQITMPLLRLGTIHFMRSKAHLANLANLEERQGIKILGLLGIGLFAEYEMLIDYSKRQIELRHIGKKEIRTYRHALLSDTSRYYAFDYDPKDGHISLKAQVGKRDIHLAVDCAAATSVMNSRLPASITDSISIGERVLLSGIGSAKVEAFSGTLSGLRLGNIAVPGLPVIITRLENTCFGGTNCIDGVIGNDFLSGYTIIINFRLRKLYILK